mmetsp:Transcript_20091/g.36330  ORF Transcript_20091/g.36330 Transcript_20091/m.36330 type:complete len:530 (-) Transcript_20091:41-1630(-)
MKYESTTDAARALATLLVLLMHQIASRYLPSFLFMVPVPGCEDVCQGVRIQPLCAWQHRMPTEVAERQCYQCRAGLENRFETTPLPEAVDQTQFASTALLQVSAVVEPLAAFDVRQHDNANVLVGAPAPADHQTAQFYNLRDGVCVNTLEYGLAMGCVFALPFVASLLPAAKICTTKPRVAIIGFSSLVTSVTLGIQAGAEEYCMLMAMRAIEGVAQAFLLTAALSFTIDLLPDASARTLACWVLNLGMSLGAGCASLGILLALLFGWRWASMIVAVIGLVIGAFWVATVAEPDRSEPKLNDISAEIPVVVDEVFNEIRVARLLTFAAAAKMFATQSFLAFLPLWLAQAGLEGFTAPAYGVANAVVASIGGVLASIIAVAAAYAGQRSMSLISWQGLASAILAIPLMCVTVLAGSLLQAMIGYFALIALTETWYGPTVLALQAYVRKSVSGEAISVFQMVALAVAGFGPVIVGMFEFGTAELGANLLWLCIAANLIAAALFWAAGQEIVVDPPHNEEHIKKVHPVALLL